MAIAVVDVAGAIGAVTAAFVAATTLIVTVRRTAAARVAHADVHQQVCSVLDAIQHVDDLVEPEDPTDRISLGARLARMERMLVEGFNENREQHRQMSRHVEVVAALVEERGEKLATLARRVDALAGEGTNGIHQPMTGDR